MSASDEEASVDLDELERLAKAAMPELWQKLGPPIPAELNSKGTREFIAAANPETVLELIRRLRVQAVLIQHERSCNGRED